jgi:hypothetical protein
VEHPLRPLVHRGLADDDEPLTVAYRMVCSFAGTDVPLVDFLDAVKELMLRDEVRLWHADSRTGDWTEWYEMPPDLRDRYLASPDFGAEWDPLDIMLTVGSNAPRAPQPWSLQLDPEKLTFVLTLNTMTEEEALTVIRRRNPSLRLHIEHRVASREATLIAGSYSQADS